jgi:signal transduction histidine kinase/ActR/RegA family two-component response regulator
MDRRSNRAPSAPGVPAAVLGALLRRRAPLYGVAALTVAAAVASRAALDPFLGRAQPFATFYVAVAVAAWIGGPGPGIAALIAGFVAADVLFAGPHGGALAPTAVDQAVGIALYFFVTSVIVALTHAMQRAGQRAHERAAAARSARRQALRALGTLDRLQQVSDAALLDRPLDDFLHELVQRVRAALGADTAVILLRDDGDVLRVRAAAGIDGDVDPAFAIPIGGGFAGRVAQAGTVVVWPEVRERTLLGPHLRAAGIRSLAGAPLRTADRVVGVVHVGTVAPRAFDDDDVRLLRLAAERVALGVERAAHLAAERRARADAETANRAKDDFLAMLGHELRNPLAAVRNAARVLAMSPALEPAAARAASIVGRQAAHVARLVDDLLDVSRIVRGKLVLRREPVGLPELVEQAVEAVRPLVERQAHALHVELPSQPVWVEADRARIVQVLGNLLTNAAKFTPPGGTIAVAAEARDGEVAVHVRDSGIGIPPETLGRIFEPFTQAGRADARHGGLGLGLAVARRLVEMHGGRIAVHSDGRGAGSEFTVVLPRALPPPAPGPATGRPGDVPGGLDVLVVDDNREAADALHMYLELLGHHCRIAPDGERALDAIRAAAPDVALIDIGLPGLSGYEVAGRVRALPAAGRPLLVAVTGHGRDEDRDRALQSGFDFYFVKPFDPDELQPVLAHAADARTAPEPRAPTLH